MTIVSASFVPGTSATGIAISNTDIQCLSLDIIALPSNNGTNAPNVGGTAGNCYFPLSWSKGTDLPLVNLKNVFIKADNNTDGVAYVYTTQP